MRKIRDRPRFFLKTPGSLRELPPLSGGRCKKKRGLSLILCLASLLLAIAPSAQALDSVSFEHGWGSDNTFIWRAGAQWKWRKQWFSERSWRLGAYWDVQAGRWTGQNGVTDIGVTPVFRLERSFGPDWWPYLEAAIGFHSVSDIRINSRRIFSTRFQYGDHIGAGLRFGERRQFDVGVRLQHLSNGGLRHPNPGINFLLVRVQYHFN